MYLKSLTISGFKSFAKKTTLEFNRGITAIVGPNGSGKSNIADAVRWVMGEQSIKTLRGKKAEDVIFSGSDKRARLGGAEVSLALDNSDKKVPLDYSDFLIARKIFRNGDSDYLINNLKSKLADVNLLLTQANFGHKTYAVIGQGMIDNFLIATPQERKEFFDEATGVKQYQIKKNQSLNKLAGTWQNLITINVKISEIEPQLRLLTKQVKKLNKRKQVEEELKNLKQDYYSSSWQEINSNYTQEKKNIDNLTQNRDELYKAWKNLETEVNKITKDNNVNQEISNLRDTEQKLLDEKIKIKETILNIKSSLIKNIKPTPSLGQSIPAAELSSIYNQLEAINKATDLDLIKNKISVLISQLKPYIKPGHEAKNNLNQADKQTQLNINKLETDIKAIVNELTNIKNKISDLSIKDSQNRSNLWQIQQQYQSSQVELNNFNNKINEARVAMARTETHRFDLMKEIEYEIGNFDSLNKNMAKFLSANDKQIAHDKINKLKQQLEIIGGIDPEIEEEYTDTKTRFDFLSKQSEDLSKTIESLKKLINDLDDIIKKQIYHSFVKINNQFKKYFKILFSGGKAELILIKSKELKTEKSGLEENNDQGEKNIINFFQEKNKGSTYVGIEIEATPPGKKLKSIGVLSGGERALTSIALICAIISSNPAPFVFLDEVDAALDESNSIRFATIIKKMSTQTQFIIITHNRITMEQADLLYGITMNDDGISKLISLKLAEASQFDNKK